MTLELVPCCFELADDVELGEVVEGGVADPWFLWYQCAPWCRFLDTAMYEVLKCMDLDVWWCGVGWKLGGERREVSLERSNTVKLVLFIDETFVDMSAMSVCG
eukprot:6489678-Amphidinium_carterae.1